MEHRAERRAIVELARLGNARHTAEFLGVSKWTIRRGRLAWAEMTSLEQAIRTYLGL